MKAGSHEVLTGRVSGPAGLEDFRVEPEPPRTTVYFDGSCPLCRAEIGHYRRSDREGALCFVDVSGEDGVAPPGVSRQQALERFHVRARDGRLVSGAAAFVEVWASLPRWRWAARAASLPGALPVLEAGYRLFLPLRPRIARLLGRARRPTGGDGGKQA